MQNHELRQADHGKNSFRYNVLMHNWYEAQHEPEYASGQACLMSDQDRLWQSEYKTIGGGKADSFRREMTPLNTPQPVVEQPMLSETMQQFTDPTGLPPTMRNFIGGKKLETYEKSLADRTTEYTETWTVSSLKTRERMKSEAQRSWVSPSQQVHAELRLFNIPTVDGLREKVWRRGGKGGFRGLVRVLRIFDENGRKRLDRYELENAFQSYGLGVKPAEMDRIMDYFDSDGSGRIAVPALLKGLRGTMDEERKALVGQAYGLLDAHVGGKVRFKHVKQFYDVREHPDVQCRSKTPEQVVAEFLGGWDKDPEDLVTWEEFLDYYEDVSTGIDSDDYFELMMRNTWHISGGQGIRANTSCRRVLVLHTDGRNTVEEIKNDLGIGADDLDRMAENLRAQGVTNIKKIQNYS